MNAVTVLKESLPDGVRRALHAVRDLPDRALQRPRHVVLRRRLAAAPPSSILVACQGNICRSPYLAAVLEKALPEVPVTSGGFVSPGRAVPAEAVQLAFARGYDLSQRRSKLVTHEMVRDAELVVVMDEMQARRLVLEFRARPAQVIVAGDLDPLPLGTRRVRDPWQQPIEIFEACFDRLDRCAWTLVSSRSSGD